MNKGFKFIWKNLGCRIWFLVTCIALVVILVASLVVTQVTFLRETVNLVLGGERPILAEGEGELAYEGDYDTKQEVYEAGMDLNVEIAEEGFTLLKNEKDSTGKAALPLSKGANISVFGKNSVNLVYSGSGSGGSSANAEDFKDLYDSLDKAGFNTNQTLKSFYEDSSKSGSGRGKNPEIGDTISGFATGETPISSYTNDITSSYSSYSDAAIVVFSRIGGEGFDLPRTMLESYGSDTKIEGAANGTDHYLQLDQNEQDLMEHVCKNFDKVIVVINSSETMELGCFEDGTYDVDAVVWTGFPGLNGIMALGEILDGDVNPSGRTVDTYAADFTKMPSYRNFGNNNETNGSYYISDYTARKYNFVDYEEGIYVGYRYYETADVEAQAGNYAGFNYDDEVVYPFGYGLSYTTFSWEIENKSALTGSMDKNGEYTIKVKVTNTGDVAGKDVVELYVAAPYTKGGIEKSAVELIGSAKTEIIQPGKSDTIEITFTPYDFASYDYSDANGNGFKGYEVEAGDYEFRVSQNAHTAVDTFTMSVAKSTIYDGNTSGFEYSTDPVTDYSVENRFDDVDDDLAQVMSRSDFAGTFPTTPTTEDRTKSSDWIKSLWYSYSSDSDTADDPWYASSMPTTGQEVTISLKEMGGAEYDDERWDTVLNQLTVDDMTNVIGNGAYGTPSILSIDKPVTYEYDGPSGFSKYMSISNDLSMFYASECVIGATWNPDLAYRMGEMIGNEGILADTSTSLPYSAWYAPAVNIHRSPFSGRNWEYYSEDGFLSGQMAAQVCLGAQSKGVVTYLKHFAVNDQETDRDQNGTLVWLTEQSMREIYLKPFEIAVKQGHTMGIMSSFNRIGTTWAGGSYELLTEVLRNEWGFQGCVITDYALNSYMNINQMLRAGGDLMLNQGGKTPESSTATEVSVLRNAMKNILYSEANSNAMNADIIGYNMPIWMEALIWVDVAIVVCLAAWGVAIIITTKKKEKRLAAAQQADNK